MRLSRLLGVLCLSTTVALTPLNMIFTDLSPAFAKGGNGGGNGNSGSHGGGSSKSGGGKGSASSSGKTAGGGSAKGASKSVQTGKTKSAKQSVSTKGAAKKTAIATAPATKPAKKTAAELAGLNSLKRNYHALMNAADPKVAAISAFATAYAQYELANGVAPPADDPVLGDAALTAALASATKTGTVSAEALSWAKDTLGVGTAVGTIDQMRDALAAAAPEAETPVAETETATEIETTDPAAPAETAETGTGSTEETAGATEPVQSVDETETSATGSEATGL
ncbi:hypothetical protein [Rhizobium lentis]|uniref:hypothetical protein n=1 Tax=Rhizobium lentis TaxID=1138194 RepID=UPI001C82AB0C|nr:hypothetical protein [Rhizobium lentis]MBX5052546.1 hypothetical protein [Rhizobium lentis]MBX5069222.1 hypothetical protein [Rhizobium lentis]MBX5113332.1 hypothetical protein [Rhizobium lentis]